jgi:hypothetical protein
MLRACCGEFIDFWSMSLKYKEIGLVTGTFTLRTDRRLRLSLKSRYRIKMWYPEGSDMTTCS